MTLNFVIPLNIVLEIAMISIQAAAYHFSSTQGVYATIDQIYFVVAAYLAASIGWAWYFYPEGKIASRWVRGFRYNLGVILICLGGFMIYSAEDIEGTNFCQFYLNCHKYELKMTAGVLAIVNGVFYFFPPCKFVPQQVPEFYTQPQQFAMGYNNGGFVGAPTSSYFPGHQQPAPYYNNNVQYGVPTYRPVQIAFDGQRPVYNTPAAQSAYYY